MDGKLKKISIIGGGYVGTSLAAVIAHHNPQFEVLVQDINETLVNKYNNKEYIIKEKSLEEYLDSTIGKNLLYTLDQQSIFHGNSNFYFICVNTDIQQFGKGANENLNISIIKNCVKEIISYLKENPPTGNIVLVEKSTVPCGTAKFLRNVFRKELNENYNQIKKKIIILSNPEFSAEGSFINDLVNADRVIIGREDQGINLIKF